MVVDDTGGLVTAAILERMGCMGRIMTFTDADSPPAWGVLNTMNFGQRELACVKWLNWLQAEENYEPREYSRLGGIFEIAARANERKGVAVRSEESRAKKGAMMEQWSTGYRDFCLMAHGLTGRTITRRIAAA